MVLKSNAEGGQIASIQSTVHLCFLYDRLTGVHYCVKDGGSRLFITVHDLNWRDRSCNRRVASTMCSRDMQSNTKCTVSNSCSLDGMIKSFERLCKAMAYREIKASFLGSDKDSFSGGEVCSEYDAKSPFRNVWECRPDLTRETFESCLRYGQIFTRLEWAPSTLVMRTTQRASLTM